MATVDESTTPPFDDENNPVLLQEKIKKLSKKLKNERKAKEDLEKRYTHLNDALQSMLTSLNKAHAIVSQAPKKIDNTTDNKQFVDKSVAQKDVDSWMNIFAKKNTGPGTPPNGNSNPNLLASSTAPQSSAASPAQKDRKGSVSDQPALPAAASPVVKKAMEVQTKQGIDNTTNNKQFVDKNHAEKDIDSWMKIFKK